MGTTASYEVSAHPPSREQLHALIEGWDAEHGEGIIRCLIRKGVPFHDAEDAKQEALRKAARYLGGGRMPRSARGWLLTIARNAATDAHRKRDREGVSWAELDGAAVAGPAVDPLIELSRIELGAAMRAAIEKLPSKQYEVVQGFYKGQKKSEIAECLEISDTAVGRLLGRALNKLREHLSEFAADVMA